MKKNNSRGCQKENLFTRDFNQLFSLIRYVELGEKNSSIEHNRQESEGWYSKLQGKPQINFGGNHYKIRDNLKLQVSGTRFQQEAKLGWIYKVKTSKRVERYFLAPK